MFLEAEFITENILAPPHLDEYNSTKLHLKWDCLNFPLLSATSVN